MSLGAPVPIAATEDVEAVEPLSNMEGYWSSAREILHRIELLEKGQVKVRHAHTHGHSLIYTNMQHILIIDVCVYL